MSTRANIVIKDDYDYLIFYRHSDGYPDGVRYTINYFMDLVKEGKIRKDASQAAGWLVLIGAKEYNTSLELHELTKVNHSSWKVGAYEPTTCIHGDIEYLYVVDIGYKKEKVECYVLTNNFDDWEKNYLNAMTLEDFYLEDEEG